MNKKDKQAIFNQFSGAPYNFFRITNFHDVRDEFLAGKATQPVFNHVGRLKIEPLAERRHKLQAIETDDKEVADFVARRLAETDLMLSFLELAKNPENVVLLKKYRQLVSDSYGEFNRENLSGIHDYLRERAAKTGTKYLFEEFEDLVQIGTSKQALYSPKPEVFEYYRSLAETSGHPIALLMGEHPLDGQTDLSESLGWALKTSGAFDAGWKIIQTDSATNVAVLKLKKEILISKNRHAGSPLRSRQVAAHEIFIHVRRTVLHNNHQSFATEEGVGILVEQLLEKSFKYKRMIRYLAAALAWGADGQPRNFAQTFDVIWRVVRIISGCDEASARERAFAECARVFRGGVPPVAGAAYIKDKIYLEANLAVWRNLENNKRSRQEFVDFLDGHEGI